VALLAAGQNVVGPLQDLWADREAGGEIPQPAQIGHAADLGLLEIEEITGQMG